MLSDLGNDMDIRTELNRSLSVNHTSDFRLTPRTQLSSTGGKSYLVRQRLQASCLRRCVVYVTLERVGREMPR